MPFRDTGRTPFRSDCRPFTAEELEREMRDIPVLNNEIEVSDEEIENAKGSIDRTTYAHACVASYQRDMSVEEYVQAAFEAYDNM